MDTSQPTGAPYQTSHINFAYELRYHLGFQTHCRKPILTSRVADAIQELLPKICDIANYHLLERTIDERHLRMMLSLRPKDAPARVVGTIKTNLSRLLRQRYELTVPKPIWGRGYVLRGVGDVRAEAVNNYVARQAEHHRRTSRVLAEYRHTAPQPYFDLRPACHAQIEYNCHLVLSPQKRQPILTLEMSQPLVGYLLEVATARRFTILSLSVLDDHVHMFGALSPDLSPADFAATVMNNSSHWLWKHDPGTFKLWGVDAIWSESAYVGTAGKITSQHVGNFIRSLS